MKKLSIILLGMLLCLCLALIPMKTQAATEGYLTYEIENGEVTITDCDQTASGEIVVPATIEGYPVTKIGNGTFAGCGYLTDITLPEGLKSIGTGAFTGCQFKTLHIPDTVMTIGEGAFYYCGLLEEIVIPEGVTVISREMFFECENLKKVTLPESVTEIGGSAFERCYDLESVNLPAALQKLGSGAFAECVSLTSAVIPEGVTVIEGGVFYCTGLKEVVLHDGITTIEISAFYGCDFEEIYISDSVTRIGPGAFHGCRFLTSIYIPDGVTAIESDTFLWCRNLETVRLPESVESIGSSAFRGCYALEEITLPESLTSIGRLAFDSCTNLKTVTYLGSVQQWEAITIGTENESLKNATLVFPSTADDRFSYVIRNGEVTITAVDQELSGELIIPETIAGYPVTNIRGYAFSKCDKLTSIFIPASVKEIGTYQSKALMRVDENNPYLASDDKGALYSKDGETLYGVPACLAGVYTVKDGVQNIAYRAFANCENLTQIILPESVTQIGEGAFGWCSKLESVNIPAGVRSLGGKGGYMFKECFSLKSITIPYGVTEIPDSSFLECTALEYVILPETVTNIGFEAFAYCENLKSIDLSHVTNIAEAAFVGCKSLDNIVLAEGLTVLRNSVFSGCSSLTNINIPSTVTKIQFNAFWNCTSLEELRIPAGVVTLENAPITKNGVWVDPENPNYCSDEKGVLYSKDMTVLMGAPKHLSGHYTIPRGVMTIEMYAFVSCHNLTAIDIPASMKVIASHAFSYCTSLAEVSSCVSRYWINIDETGDGNAELLKAKWNVHTLTNQKVIVKPTCTTMGQTEAYCKICDTTQIVFVNTVGHNYGSYRANDSGHWRYCIHCGIKEDADTRHYFYNGKCTICFYEKESAATPTQPTTKPTSPTVQPTIIPIPASSTAQTQPTQSTPQVQQPQQNDPTGIIIVIAVVLALAGCTAIVLLMRKKD